MVWWLLGVSGYLLVVLLICRAFRVATQPAPDPTGNRPVALASSAETAPPAAPPSESGGIPDQAA